MKLSEFAKTKSMEIGAEVKEKRPSEEFPPAQPQTEGIFPVRTAISPNSPLHPKNQPAKS